MGVVAEARDAMSLIPKPWRPPATMAALTGVAVVGWFVYIGGPLAEAQEAGVQQGKRLTVVESAVQPIRKDLDGVKSAQAKQGQQLEDLKDSVASVDRKLDILLQRDRASR